MLSTRTIRQVLLYVCMFFPIASIASVFGTEKLCTGLTNCKKGDVLYIQSKYLALYCDLEKKVIVADGKVTCFYIGEKRELRSKN